MEVKNKNWNYDLISNRANLLFSSVENKTRNIIILVSDTIPDEAEIQGQLDALSVYSPRFMPIILGNKNADLTDLEAVTCLSEGLLTHDKNKNQYIPDMMIEYSKYFTDNLNVNKPLWSPIYNDAFGFGLLVTVTMPVYSTNENGSFLIGVVGLDVTIEYLR